LIRGCPLGSLPRKAIVLAAFPIKSYLRQTLILPKVQIGLEAMKKPGFVTFASYGKTKIRHFHQLYERWLALV